MWVGAALALVGVGLAILARAVDRRAVEPGVVQAPPVPLLSRS